MLRTLTTWNAALTAMPTVAMAPHLGTRIGEQGLRSSTLAANSTPNPTPVPSPARVNRRTHATAPPGSPRPTERPTRVVVALISPMLPTMNTPSSVVTICAAASASSPSRWKTTL